MVVCGSLVAMWVSEMSMEFKPHLILGIEVPFRICAPTVLLTCEIIWITGNLLRRVLARAGKLFASRCVPCVGFTLALFFWLQNLFKQDKFSFYLIFNAWILLLVCSKSSVNGKHAQYISEDDFEFPKLIPIRAQTAPPRPLSEIEEFRRSSDFLLLENTVMMSDHLK